MGLIDDKFRIVSGYSKLSPAALTEIYSILKNFYSNREIAFRTLQLANADRSLLESGVYKFLGIFEGEKLLAFLTHSVLSRGHTRVIHFAWNRPHSKILIGKVTPVEFLMRKFASGRTRFVTSGSLTRNSRKFVKRLEDTGDFDVINREGHMFNPVIIGFTPAFVKSSRAMHGKPK